MPVLFIAGIIILIIAIGIVGRLMALKRRKELMAWAQAHGLRFIPSRDASIDERFPGFSCLRRGSNRYAFNISEGTIDNRQIRAFDYHYETHSTDSKGRRKTHHHYFSAVIINTNLLLKPLFIRPENMFDKLTEFFGFDDIDFESAAFSRAFFVKSPDRRWAYDVIQQSTMEFLLSSPRYTIEFDRSYILACRNSRFSPVEFDAALDVAAGIVTRLPLSLVKEITMESRV
jgi:hypothetical protein